MGSMGSASVRRAEKQGGSSGLHWDLEWYLLRLTYLYCGG
jgi:hypothetical protein